MIIPHWAFVSVILLLILLVALYLHRLGTADNDLCLEDFLTSKEPDGTRRANPHKLAFLLAFVICAWINIVIAPQIATSVYVLYYSLAFMLTFTISLLSKTALTLLKDIVQIWVTKQAPSSSPSNSLEEETDESSKKENNK